MVYFRIFAISDFLSLKTHFSVDKSLVMTYTLDK